MSWLITFVSKNALLFYFANFLLVVTGLLLTAYANLNPTQKIWFWGGLVAMLSYAAGNLVLGLSLYLSQRRGRNGSN